MMPIPLIGTEFAAIKNDGKRHEKERREQTRALHRHKKGEGQQP